jgi:MinD superfamily P-loop ATPase|tara:strand:- start:545 stop:745 length:201 start_codon:yes stop_codon:yes gene_type:complete
MDEVKQEDLAKTGKVEMNADEYAKLIKKYKKTKKYMKSNLFAIKTMDGTEKYVSKLLKEADEAEGN